MVDNKFDVIIIGGGPAGLTAGLYTSRAGLKSLLIEKGIIGGQITYAEHVENFPGFPVGISGMELGEKMHDQARKYGLEVVQSEAEAIHITGKLKNVTTQDVNYESIALVLAGGSQRRKLRVPGESQFTGRGVSYCATCDAPFFRDVPITVVGGGDVALTEALHMTKIASKVTVIHRRNALRATKILQDRAMADSKIEFIWNTTVNAIEGDETVKQIKLTDVKNGQISLLKTDGIFIAVGFLPETQFIKQLLKLDSTGHIITNEKMETSAPGIFACGDIRQNSGRQAITAAGDGATAAIYAQKYLTEN